MFAEIRADEVKGYGIDARIDVSQNKSENPERVPEIVVIVLRVGVKVEPQKEDVHW
jgi:hypothetical protein